MRVLKGAKGDKGDKGDPGPVGGRMLKRARGPLSGGKVVRVVDDGDHVDVASALVAADAAAVVGLTLQSAVAAEDQVEVAHAGELEDSAWSFVPGPVYLGVNGVLTQTRDSSWAFLRIVGTAVSPTKMMINLRPPVFLAQGG